jgi:DNA-binding NtrC family response regulator
MNNRKPTILVVDDELSIRESFGLILGDAYNVIIAASGEAALKKLVDEKIDLAYLDIRMPGLDGIETLRRMKGIDKDTAVIMVTAVNDVQKVSEAINAGAEDYVVKPFDVNEILDKTERTLRQKGIKNQKKNLQASALGSERPELIGRSKRIEEIRSKIENIAGKDLSVLISGEIGTEKAVIAEVLHLESGRAPGKFAGLVLSRRGDQDMRTVLFGGGSGTYTENLGKEKGLFEGLNGGTIYLENIEDLPGELQNELASVLRNKEIRREDAVGSIPTDVRIISSTSTDLKELVGSGAFSKALYEILSEAAFEVPPLRDRMSDLDLLIGHLIEKFGRVHGGKLKGLTADAIEALSGYDFPANYEELECLIEMAVLSCRKEKLSADMLPLYILAGSRTFGDTEEGAKIKYDNIYESTERTYIERILSDRGGDHASAAKLLGITPRALSAKLESLNIRK